MFSTTVVFLSWHNVCVCTSFHLSNPCWWKQYLRSTLMEICQIWHKHSLGLKWFSFQELKVKVSVPYLLCCCVEHVSEESWFWPSEPLCSKTSTSKNLFYHKLFDFTDPELQVIVFASCWPGPLLVTTWFNTCVWTDMKAKCNFTGAQKHAATRQ